MGSKISIFVIVVAMIFLAGVLFEVPENVTVERVAEEHQTYSEIENERKKQDVTYVFENFPAPIPLYTGAVADVNFATNPLAQNFKDIIEQGVAGSGVNFAGEFSIVTWSCGDDCQNSAIVNVRTGEIVSHGIMSQFGLSFSSDSSLLIINPKENALDEKVVTDYYEMTDKQQLEFRAKEVSETGVVEDCIQAFFSARNVLTNEVKEFGSPCKVPFGWEVLSTKK